MPSKSPVNNHFHLFNKKYYYLKNIIVINPFSFLNNNIFSSSLINFFNFEKKYLIQNNLFSKLFFRLSIYNKYLTKDHSKDYLNNLNMKNTFLSTKAFQTRIQKNKLNFVDLK
jgi:hypothetical protein